MDPQERLDGAESIFFARELEAIDAKAYMTDFPMLKGRTLIPKVNNVGESDREYTYRQYTTVGSAKIIANGADDIPSVDVDGLEFTTRIKPLADKYAYDLFEIRAAAAKGKPLDELKARAARQGIETLIDSLLAFGSAPHGMTGFANSAAVDRTTYAPSSKTTSNEWLLANSGTGATGVQVVGDVLRLVNQVWAALKEAESLGGPLTVVLPAPEYAFAAGVVLGTGDGGKSALEFILANPFVEAVVPWHKLTDAGDSGKNRMIAYRKDPTVLGALVPMEFAPQPVQQKGLLFERNCLASCGGTVIRYPIAMAYGDGI